MHDLIKDSAAIKSMDFGGNIPPTLSPNKGEWLPRVIIQPPFDPALQTQSLAKTVTETESVWEYVVVDKSIESVKIEKIAALIELSEAEKVKGITVDGDAISTADKAVSQATSTLSLMGRNPTEAIPVRTKGGKWITGNKAKLEAIQTAMWAHIKAAAENEKAHSDAINALATPQAVADYDISAGWG